MSDHCPPALGWLRVSGGVSASGKDRQSLSIGERRRRTGSGLCDDGVQAAPSLRTGLGLRCGASVLGEAAGRGTAQRGRRAATCAGGHHRGRHGHHARTRRPHLCTTRTPFSPHPLTAGTASRMFSEAPHARVRHPVCTRRTNVCRVAAVVAANRGAALLAQAPRRTKQS